MSDALVSTAASPGPVLLFDGTCNLCNHAIQFVLDHERDHQISFVSLQSTIGRSLLESAFGAEKADALVRGTTGTGDPDSLVFIEDGRGYLHSDGALRVARHLRAPFAWLAAFRVVPRFLRDGVYRWIARNRYAWFGRSDTCRIPTPDLRARFLDSAEKKGQLVAKLDGPSHAGA